MIIISKEYDSMNFFEITSHLYIHTLHIVLSYMKLLKYNNGKIFHFLSNGPGFNPKNNCFSVIIFFFTLATVSAAILMLSSMYACLKWRVLKWHEKRSFPLFQEWKRRHLILFRTKVHSMLKNTKCVAYVPQTL